MTILDQLTAALGRASDPGPVYFGPQARSIDTFDTHSPLADQLAAIRGRARPWRLASIREALGVPSIQRAVTLISNSTGSLSVEAIRNGITLPPEETPRLVLRPDPYETPDQTYSDMAWAMATRGETVLWIAARDSNGSATSLIVVPLAELKVEENPRNRLLPRYTWSEGNAKREGTRYSPANPEGRFVHIFYLREHRFSLRGVGPLQLAGAATSVSVEAQEWAANFYAAGGNPSVNLHSEDELEGNEAQVLRNEWIATPANMPQVTSGPISIRDVPFNTQGAQMLEARDYNNGDAARIYGIPGSLLEYQRPGASLTYQNRADLWTDFVKGCLAINYLEKIEQALSDLLPRTMVVRFSVEGLQRADVKTRWEVYEKAVAVLGPEEAAEYARRREGLVPGDLERAPIPAAPPAAIPAPIVARTATEIRCDGMAMKMRSGVSHLAPCNKLLTRDGRPYVGICPRCKKVYEPAAVA